MTEPLETTHYDDEVDLRALLEVLIRRKAVILAITLAAMAAALGWSAWVVPPVFESEVRLFLPAIDADLAMTPQQYAAYAVSDPVIGPLGAAVAPEQTPQAFAERFSVRLDGGNTILDVTVSAPTAEESRQLASLWLQSFGASVQEFVQRRLERALAEAETRVTTMTEGLAALGDALGFEQSERDLALHIAAAAYGQQYGEALRERSRLVELRENLTSFLELHVLLGPTLPTGPSSPRILLNVVVGGVLGLMLGIFLALGLEWWSGADPAGERPAR